MKITEEHIKLLAAMADLLEHEGDYGNVPEFNAKRPFGNSMPSIIARDAMEIMGHDVEDFDLDDDEAIEEILDIVGECTPVLKAILRSPDMKDFIGSEIEG